MNRRRVITALLLAIWVLWSPVALASHMGVGGRPMCAGHVDSSSGSEPGVRHLPAHDDNMEKTGGEPCSLGLCLGFISAGVFKEAYFSSEAHAQHPPQNLLMALPQVPDPVPKSLHLSA